MGRSSHCSSSIAIGSGVRPPSLAETPSTPRASASELTQARVLQHSAADTALRWGSAALQARQPTGSRTSHPTPRTPDPDLAPGCRLDHLHASSQRAPASGATASVADPGRSLERKPGRPVGGSGNCSSRLCSASRPSDSDQPPCAPQWLRRRSMELAIIQRAVDGAWWRPDRTARCAASSLAPASSVAISRRYGGRLTNLAPAWQQQPRGVRAGSRLTVARGQRPVGRSPTSQR